VIDEKRGYYVHYRLNEQTFAKWKEAINVMLDMKINNFPGKKGKTKCVAAKKTTKYARSQRT
jgi:hypothetical protein